MRLKLILFFVILFNPKSFCQNVDSLFNPQNNINDTTRISLSLKAARQYRAKNHSTGIEICEKAIALSRKINNKIFLARSLNEAAFIAYRDEDFTSSKKYLRQVFEMENTPVFSRERANAYYTLGSIHYETGNYSDALSDIKNALALIDKKNDAAFTANLLTVLGRISRSMEQTDDALKYMTEAIGYFRQAGDSNSVASAYNTIGITYYNLKKFDEALAYLFSSLKLKKQFSKDNEHLSNAYHNISNVYRDLNDFSNAEKYLDSAFLIAGNNASPHLLNQLNRSKAKLYLTSGRIPEAISLLENVLLYCERENNYKLMESVLINLCQAYQKQVSAPGISDSSKLFYSQKALERCNKSKAIQDSVRNAENFKNIKELNVKYETEKKEKEIVKLNFDKQQKEISLQQNKLALTQAELDNKDKQQQLEISEASRRLNELELREAENKNKILLLQKQKEAEQSRAEIQRKSFLNYIFGGGIAALAIILFFAIGFFRQKQKFEKQKAIEQTRSSIAGDLHDDIGATLSSINIYSKLAKEKFDNDAGHVKSLLQKINDTSQEMMNNMSDMVWAIKPDNDAAENLSLKIKSFAREILSPKEIYYKIESNENGADKISMEARRNIFLIAKEAINNIAKYSEAKNVSIKLQTQNGHLNLEIEDDGVGFSSLPSGEGRGGAGIGNMKQRTEQLRGKFHIESAKGNGTKIKSVFDLDKINY